MQVTVFGATGGVGRHVVGRLLDSAHGVTAYVRSPAKPFSAHAGLTVRTGELSDAAAVRSAIVGSDAVISALGPNLNPFASGAPLTEGTRHVVVGMRASGVTRFIGLTTAAVPDSRDGKHWKHPTMPVVASVLFPKALKEVRGMTAVVANSELDWTIARITCPSNRAATGSIRAGFLGSGNVGSVMSKADIAAFLVSQLDDRSYIRAAPAISN